ncbi:Zn-dependent protease [Haloferax prahovense DSM 18310]|uniref:Zinc metalloprotease n=1 Tax=Haloferax prahovense (strain DSM 18310 / JCM 13924 / TL6) TaxID=1227461 RepID=M0FXE9_HALPT|nr:CBS domain-containing protein [Haloferax prahovense]ELZ63953.1 Zn-dependent protease [Haloferax prahovense DSM 18310]
MRGFRVGSAFGIPVRLNWTFLIVLPLFAVFIAGDIAELVVVINQTFGATMDPNQLTDGNLPWVLGLASALGLFTGVLLHEFGHSLVALRYGYEIDSITLWLLGGVASFTEFPEDWRHELVIAIAGPIVSVLLGVGSYVVFITLPPGVDAARFVFGYLAILNIVLAAFNLLPGFPMDGGRILRALLARNQPHAKATQQAAAVGKVFAFGLGLLGLFTNLFLIVLAFFIYIAASGEAQQTTIKAAFEGISVSDVMTPGESLETVSEETTISDLLARMFTERHIGYPVLRNGDLVGIVTLDDAAAVEEVERDAYRVEDVMSTDLYTISPDADAMTAFQQMQQNGVGRLPVVNEAGDLVGIISRTDMMRAFNVIQSGGPPQTLDQPISGPGFQ